MSDASKSVECCPACKADTIKFWERRDAWICGKCGFVLADDGEDRVPDDLERALRKDDNDESLERPWQERVVAKDKSEANLIAVLELTADVANALYMQGPRTARAAELVTAAWEENMMHGRRRETMVAAALYAASREHQQSIPPGAIAKALDIQKARLKTVYQDLKHSLGMDLEPPLPGEYVEFICTDLGIEMSSTARKNAKTLLSNNRQRGGNPIGIAAAGVYLSCQENHETTLSDIAKIVGLTKETVWRHADKLRAVSISPQQ